MKILHILFVFFTVSSSYNVENLCSQVYDFSGRSCREFSKCPLEEGSEFLGLSLNFPCLKYVVDDPDLYDLSVPEFRRYVLNIYKIHQDQEDEKANDFSYSNGSKMTSSDSSSSSSSSTSTESTTTTRKTWSRFKFTTASSSSPYPFTETTSWTEAPSTTERGMASSGQTHGDLGRRVTTSPSSAWFPSENNVGAIPEIPKHHGQFTGHDVYFYLVIVGLPSAICLTVCI